MRMGLLKHNSVGKQTLLTKKKKKTYLAVNFKYYCFLDFANIYSNHENVKQLINETR